MASATPDLRLPSTGTKVCCLVIEADVCEQLAYARYKRDTVQPRCSRSSLSLSFLVVFFLALVFSPDEVLQQTWRRRYSMLQHERARRWPLSVTSLDRIPSRRISGLSGRYRSVPPHRRQTDALLLRLWSRSPHCMRGEE